MPLKMQERAYYSNFSKFLTIYEQQKDKAEKGVGELRHVRLVSGQSGDYLKNKLEGLANEFQNPMKFISHWVKGEVYNLESLAACSDAIGQCELDKKKALSNIEDVKIEI